jgi:hypothetical protein
MANKIYVTTLPNDRTSQSGNQGPSKLKLSVLLTPSLDTGDALPPPFAPWPKTAAALQWQATFYDTKHNPIKGATFKPQLDPENLPRLDSDLWGKVFAAVAGVKVRTGSRHLHKTWRLSHNITSLHNDHQVLRLAQAYQHYGRQMGAPEPAAMGPIMRSLRPPNLFLHPSFGSDLARQFADRNQVLSQWGSLIAGLPAAALALLKRRVGYAVTHLEKYGGAKLSGASLCAVYESCLQSLMRPGKPDAVLDPLLQSIYNTVDAWPRQFQGPHVEVTRLTHYLMLLLFHRRETADSSRGAGSKNPPDFHQLLGLVQHYPAVMRSLGLVFDFVVAVPSGFQGAYSVTVSATSPDPAVTGIVTFQSLFTQCTITPDTFYATPENADLVKYRFLNLNAKSVDGSARYSLVAENADGQALKLTDQNNNTSRGSEFTTSAPTAMSSPSTQPSVSGGVGQGPHATANPSTNSPAPRTVGLALFDNDRLIHLEKNVGKEDPPAPGTPPSPRSDLYAEDLTVGYRVDVAYKGRFYSLCERNSDYRIYKPETNDPWAHWYPMSPIEKAADEGYVTFSATQSVLQSTDDPSDSTNTQTQVHQSVFTWSGWSLSVPQNDLPQMNPETASNSLEGAHAAIRPLYTLKGQLPPLRFEPAPPQSNGYLVRCRVVDLAGNSLPPEADRTNQLYSDCSLKPDPDFSRLEPIRAPEFLLVSPIDRSTEPGTHIDRLVARDGGDGGARILAAPRESLHMAELSGELKGDRLPPSAFATQQLWRDGSFPSVLAAKKEGWVEGQLHEKWDRDPIFLTNVSGIGPENPYYPDPMANFVRVDAFIQSDDPSQSRPMGTAWLPINPDHKWPERFPAQIRLVPKSDAGDPTTEVSELPVDSDDSDGSFVPTLNVNLPRSQTVQLVIRSTAISGDAAAEAARNHPPVHLHALSQKMVANASTLISARSGNEMRNAIQELARHVVAKTVPAPQAQDFINGNVGLMTPSRVMTLVHAVQRPLEPPEFGPSGKPGELQVIREADKAEANVTGALRAHWLSTDKITCYANWSDCIDNVTKAEPEEVHQRHVAFAVANADFEKGVLTPATRFRTLSGGLKQHFTDTRAHEVTYSLSASTRFREYYPGAGAPDQDDTFKRAGKNPTTWKVLASVAPPAPSIRYIVPAFLWSDAYEKESKTWVSGRTVLARVWLDRPFKVQGDREILGVVLADPHSPTAVGEQQFASRWGADPARVITAAVLKNELTEDNLCEESHPVENCLLEGTQSARVKPCEIQYCKERKLWFADIPINTQGANAPFVRLAIVRWQPDAITGTMVDARVSKPVFADFMQIGADRWVSIQRLNHRRFRVTISGPFAPPDSNIAISQQPIDLKLQGRWYALRSDLGWRTVDCKAKFTFAPPPTGSNVATWSTELDLPHSSYNRKYRLFLSETDWFADGTTGLRSFTHFVELP